MADDRRVFIVDTAVEPGVFRFGGGVAEGLEGAARDAELEFGAVGISKVIAEIAAKRFRCGGGDGTMAAGVFREGRCLEMGAPVGIEIFVDGRFGAERLIDVLYIPALDKSVEEGDSGFCVGCGGGGEIAAVLFGGDADDAHPVTCWRELFGAEHQVAGYV